MSLSRQCSPIVRTQNPSEVLAKTSGAGEPQRVTVGDRSYKAALNHCDVVDKSGAVGAVLTLIMVDITKILSA